MATKKKAAKKKKTAPKKKKTAPKKKPSSTRASSIRQKVWLPGRAKDIYSAWLDGKKQSAFTGARATGSARKGARFTAWDGYIEGKNLELVPGERIVQEWTTTEWPKGHPPSVLTLTLKERDGGTEVTLVQTNVPKGQAKGYDEGWHQYYWEPLSVYLAGGA